MENKLKLLVKIDQLKTEIGEIQKMKYNSMTDSSFADINAILNQIEPIAKKNGLLVIQPVEVTTDNMNVVSTTIIDLETGEDISSSILIPATITNPQQIGSCVTYFRRYTLKSLLALQEVDDDANSASGNSILSDEEMSILDKMSKKKEDGKIVENSVIEKLKGNG